MMIDEEYLIKVNSVFIFVVLAGVVVIGILIHNIVNINKNINNEILNIEKKIPKTPKCPECPKCDIKCPDCPECPQNDINCPECPECPKCSNSENSTNNSNSKKSNSEIKDSNKDLKCPDVKCPKCPTVKEIVNGVFPGRNPTVIEDRDYYEVNSDEAYDGMSTYSFYQQKYNFPIDKILKPDAPMRKYNIQGESFIDNSNNNNLISYSQNSQKLTAPKPFNTIESEYLESYVGIEDSNKDKKDTKKDKKDPKKDK